ncbi:MAG: MG2 domain-containing protein, partial [Bacteroidota bacterium]
MNKFKNLTSYFALLVFIILISSFQLVQDELNFDGKWETVEGFAKKGQPKSALKIVDEIYISAKADNNTPQIIKSLIYRISLQSSFEEDHIIKSINVFETELASASSPEKQILQSLIAELYQAYYSTNSWKINQRQALLDYNNEHIEAWDAVKINKVIDNYYTLSVENRQGLEQIKLNDFEAILLKEKESNFTLWPSLYDLLANRALIYFTSTDADLAQIGTPKHTGDINYFIPVDEFVVLKIDPKKSQQNKVLNLFQKLLSFHVKQNNTEALVDLDLKRLQFVSNNSVKNENSRSRYIESLKLLANKFKNHPTFVLISYDLATQYNSTGNNYDPEFDNEGKYDLAIADSICKQAIKLFPDVNGTNKCRNLIETINEIDFGFDISVAEMPNRPILSLVKFKNIDKLYFKIINGNPKSNANRNNRKGYLLNELKKQDVVLSWEQELPKTTDHHIHRVEVKMPEFAPGYYIIFASNNSQFSIEENIKFKSIWITNISYITSTNKVDGTTDMFTLNRETGKSIGNVNITVFKREYDTRSREYMVKEAHKLTTDNYGYAKIESISGSNYGTFLFMFEKDGNGLFSENYLNFYKPKQNTKSKIHTFLFTDRMVYRPGQTVYFKGIVTEELNGSIKLLKDYDIELEFKNASRKVINTSKFVTNNSGSFNGSFIIPIGGLNGQMTIKCSTGSVRFLVENYKLPTFEVLFDSIVGQPKLGQSVTMSGKVVSYSGSVVDGASVVYSVVRRATFPRPYYKNVGWYAPYTGREIEIATGKT